jgi:hypothetical protein
MLLHFAAIPDLFVVRWGLPSGIESPAGNPRSSRPVQAGRIDSNIIRLSCEASCNPCQPSVNDPRCAVYSRFAPNQRPTDPKSRQEKPFMRKSLVPAFALLLAAGLSASAAEVKSGL